MGEILAAIVAELDELGFNMVVGAGHCTVLFNTGPVLVTVDDDLAVTVKLQDGNGGTGKAVFTGYSYDVRVIADHIESVARRLGEW